MICKCHNSVTEWIHKARSFLSSCHWVYASLNLSLGINTFHDVS
jgi:hypothetical protein